MNTHLEVEEEYDFDSLLEEFHGQTMEAAETVTLSDVAATTIDWIWEGRVAKSRITLLDGQPGDSKSTLLMDLVARVSTGTDMPDGTPTEAGDTLILCSEDSLDTTTVPRLLAAGADLSKVHVLSRVPDFANNTKREVSLPGDIAFLHHLVNTKNVKLLIIDPLQTFITKSKPSMNALVTLAEETGVAIVAIRHLTKATSGRALLHGRGGIEVVGSARQAHMIVLDPKNPDERLMLCTKSNIVAKPKTMRYKLVSDEQYGVAKIEWLGEDDFSEVDLYDVPKPEEMKSLKMAVKYLEHRLAGGPVPTKLIEDEARQKLCLSRRTVERARQELGVKAFRASDQWMLLLPRKES